MNSQPKIKNVYLMNSSNPNGIYAADPKRFERFETPEHYLKRTEKKAITCYTNMLVNQPSLFCVVVGVIFAMSIVVDWFLYHMDDSAVEQLYPEGDRYTNAVRARKAAQNQLIDYFGRSTPEGIRPQSQKEDFDWHMIVMAELVDKSENVYIFDDPTHFKTIYDFEDRFLNHQGFDDLCYVDAAQDPEVPFSHEACLQFAVTSVLRIYLDMVGSAFGYISNERSPSEVWYPAFEANELNAKKENAPSSGIMTVQEFTALMMEHAPDLADLFGESGAEMLKKENWQNPTSPFVQTFIYLASPVPTEWVYEMDQNGTKVLSEKHSEFNSHFDQKQKQIEEHLIEKMLQEMWDDIVVEHNAEYQENGVNLYFHQMAVWYRSIKVLVMSEATYLFGLTFLVVFIYVTYTVGSLFLSAVCTLQIIITFPIGYFFFRGVFQITRFDPLCGGVVFVLMAVGVYYYPAFVFLDSWLQSVNIINEFDREGSRQQKYFHKRMAVAFRRSSVGILSAQTTTLISFLSCGVANMVFFRVFGLWAATCIVVNFFLNITFFPASIILWEYYVEKKERKFANWLKTTAFKALACAFDVHLTGYMQIGRGIEEKKKLTRKKSFSQLSMNEAFGDDEDDEDWTIDIGFGPQTREQLIIEYHWIGFQLGTAYSDWLWRMRVPIGILCNVWFAFAIYGVTQLRKLESNEEFHDYNHHMFKTLDTAITRNPIVNRAGINIIYGIMDEPVPGTRDIWDVKSNGQVSYDSNLDVSSVAAQRHLDMLCERMQDGFDNMTFVDGANCWISGFKEWIQTQEMDGNRTWSFPLDLQDYLDVIGDGTTASETEQKILFIDQLCLFVHGEPGYFTDYNSTGPGFEHYEPFSNLDIRCHADRTLNELKFFQFTSSIPVSLLGERKKADLMQQKWEQYQDAIINGGDCKSEKYCNALTWSMRWGLNAGYDALVKSAVWSVATTIPLVFVFIVILLHNWIIALICVYLIAVIMASVMFMTSPLALDWDYGFAESTSNVMVVGFAVDYTVHFAHGYLSAIAKDRKGRTTYTMFQNGHSVTSGAVASLLAAVPLLGQSFMILRKTAVLILCVVVFSALFSSVLLPICLMLFGPNGNEGELLNCCKAMRGNVSVPSSSSGLSGGREGMIHDIDMKRPRPGIQTEYDLN